MESLRHRLGLQSLAISLPAGEEASGEDIRPAPVQFYLHVDGQRVRRFTRAYRESPLSRAEWSSLLHLCGQPEGKSFWRVSAFLCLM